MCNNEMMPVCNARTIFTLTCLASSPISYPYSRFRIFVFESFYTLEGLRVASDAKVHVNGKSSDVELLKFSCAIVYLELEYVYISSSPGACRSSEF